MPALSPLELAWTRGPASSRLRLSKPLAIGWTVTLGREKDIITSQIQIQIDQGRKCVNNELIATDTRNQALDECMMKNGISDIFRPGPGILIDSNI